MTESPRRDACRDARDLPGGAQIVHLQRFADNRGELFVAAHGSSLSFDVRRVFIVRGVPAGVSRAGHANRVTQELLIVAAGSVRVSLSDGSGMANLLLDDPEWALYVPPMVWLTLYDHSRDAVLVAAAAPDYDPASTIWDFDEYVRSLGDR